MVQAFLLLITNMMSSSVDRQALQQFNDLPIDDPHFKHNGDYASHLADLLEANNMANIDEMVRVWARANEDTYSVFYLDHP